MGGESLTCVPCRPAASVSIYSGTKSAAVSADACKAANGRHFYQRNQVADDIAEGANAHGGIAVVVVEVKPPLPRDTSIDF